MKEYERIFSDLFNNKSPQYTKIVSRLAQGSCELEELRSSLKIERGGRLTDYLYDLETAGFISKDQCWHFKSKKEAKRRKYRLKDNYIRFYLKYIEPNLSRIEKDRYPINPIQWTTIFGLQFENLVLNMMNRNRLLKILKISLGDVVWDNPYFQKSTSRHKGCQIDYLIQTRDQTLYLCEIKFSQSAVSPQVMEDVRQKVEALSPPKGFSVRPILIHVNGVSDQILAEEYFSNIIDFSQLLQPPPQE